MPGNTDRTERVQRAAQKRSLLFVPANRERFIAGAFTRGADAVVLDLEDSIPTGAKSEARQAVTRLRSTSAGTDLLIRVNRDFPVLLKDLDASVVPWVSGLVVPKVEDPAGVHVLDALVMERELAVGLQPGSLDFHLLIESATGIENCEAIARSCPRVVSLALGTEDLANEFELDPHAPGFDLRWAHGRLLLAARASAITPYGLLRSLADFADDALTETHVREAREFGFRGAYCVHPRQVPLFNAGFAPSHDELARAHQVVQEYERACAHGYASTMVDGCMIDEPVAARARSVLARADIH